MKEESDKIEIRVRGENFDEKTVDRCFVYKVQNLRPTIYLKKVDEAEEKSVLLICILKGPRAVEKDPMKEECGKTRRQLVNDAEKFRCHTCNKSISRKDLFEAHLRRHGGDMDYECQSCRRRFSSEAGLRIHNSKRVGCSAERKCNTCNQQYCRQENYCEHIRKEKLEAQKAKYVSRRLRAKTKPCPVCGKLFLFESEVKMHMVVTHTKEKCFVCEKCGKSFKTNQCFKIHERIHRDRRPYPCLFCEKKFRTLNHIKQHVRTHTGEKPYKCPVCGKGFAQSGDMKKHLTKIHCTQV